ncbi:PREDICTED: uncharacterized protein LOC106813329 [Priapulus caudatus]|uniref:Uncharacterized protein LOC106813329 n=1 Tax=Priapulus caudatus TaxID=37621 RepID=A0ABM1EL67_PRICU|nr:PREDICTED: uncharacterized protein LOC106813329 [Priapulus caudatus]
MESAAFCHHASHFIRTIVFLVIIALPSNTSETSWYQGCVLPDGESFNLQISNASSPALCSAACLAQGYEYAAVHGDSQCGCLHQLSRLKLVQSVSCNVSCSSFPNLACGGATGWSAYSTSALYLLNVSVRAERRVVMGERTVLEAEARLAAAAVNGSREVENGMADVSFVWSVGGAAVPSRAPPGSSRAVSRLIRRFDEPGNYSVGTKTSGGDVGPVTYSFGDGTLVTSSSTNTVSHVYDSVGIYELSAHLEGVAAALPSVVSVQAPIEGLQIHGPLAVEMGSAPVHSRWEAVVESGSDILYTWAVNGTVTQSPYNTFSHVFHETGVFRVSVSGENALGSSPSPPATAIVHVQRPIVEVRVVAPATALRGRDVEVVVEVVGGGNDPITVTTTYVAPSACARTTA